MYTSWNHRTFKNIENFSGIGVAQWVARLPRNVEVAGSSPIKGPVVSLNKKLYPYCLVLVGSRNGFECDITIKLK